MALLLLLLLLLLLFIIIIIIIIKDCTAQVCFFHMIESSYFVP